MSVTRAALLAAGAAKRLKPLTDDRPKCMLEVGDRPILAHLIAALRAHGVDDLAVVVGFREERVRDLLGDTVTYIRNVEYATTNSLHSLWLARRHLEPGGLILNSDVLVHPANLRLLLDGPPSALLYDPAAGKGDAEAMKLALDVDRSVRRLSKELPDDETEGENLGIIKLDAEGMAAGFSALKRMMSSECKRAWVPEMINVMRPTKRVVAIAATHPWTEIDTPTDLDHAREAVWPLMREAHAALTR
jgi:choline kinase